MMNMIAMILATLAAVAPAPELTRGPVTVYQDNRGLSCGSRIAEGQRTMNRVEARRVRERLLAAGHYPVKVVVLEDGDRVTGDQDGGSVMVQGVSPQTRC